MSWTVLTAPREVNREDGKQLLFSMVASKKIYKGDFVKVNTAGYAVGSDTAPATGDMFVGISLETVDNSSGGAGAKSVLVATEGVVDAFKASTVIADVGHLMYADIAADAQTVSLTTGSHSVVVGHSVGRVFKQPGIVDTTKIRVKIRTCESIAA